MTAKKPNFTTLRARHPVFSYTDYSFALEHDNLVLTFTYSLGPDLTFHHHVTFHHVDGDLFARQDPTLIDSLVFHLGIIESFSYWKLAASPEFRLTCGSLDPKQTQIWHDWLIGGMGEYFYVNQIDFTSPDFVRFVSSGPTHLTPRAAIKNHSGRRSLVNLGGGKDSAVMLSLLTHAQEDFANFMVEPHSPAAHKQAKLSGQPTYTATRTFDSLLRKLNGEDYLNGHVPFSASVAFINLLAGVLYDADYGLVGNESSADEVSLTWLGQPINHQFSKSTKFEQSFQTYCSQYLLKNFTYFSFLRVFNEFQIAHIFCTNPLYWPSTRSCNRGQRDGIWCGQCPKCLFVYLLLACFLEPDTLTTQIFDHDLLADPNLSDTLAELVGLRPTKPLECVGTRDECAAAFYLVYTKCIQSGQPLPYLIDRYRDAVLALHTNYPALVHNLSTYRHPTHSLPSWALTIVQSAYDQILLSAN